MMASRVRGFHAEQSAAADRAAILLFQAMQPLLAARLLSFVFGTQAIVTRAIMSTPLYPFEEFLKHMAEVHSSARLEPGSWEGNVIKVNEYMKRIYPEGREKQYKLTRFILIMDYVSNHIHQLDRSDYAVYGSEKAGALVGQHVLQAVHEIFTTKDLAELEQDPDPDEVMRLADKYRDQEA